MNLREPRETSHARPPSLQRPLPPVDSKSVVPAKRSRSDKSEAGRRVGVKILQGGAREGWLRSNDRTMVMVITLSGITPDEALRWQRSLQGTNHSERFEIKIQLVYDDLSHVQMKEKRSGFPDRLRLLKFDGSIKAEGDVVKAPGNSFTISTRDGTHLMMNDGYVPPDWEPWQIARASTAGCEVLEISLKLTTNMTSKSHSGRKFVFTADVKQFDEDGSQLTDIRGVSSVFELIAKHKMSAGQSPSLTPRLGPQESNMKISCASPMITPRARSSSANQKKRSADTRDKPDVNTAYTATWKRFAKAVDTVLLQARSMPSSEQHVEWLKSIENKYSPCLMLPEAAPVQVKQLPNLQEILASWKCTTRQTSEDSDKRRHVWHSGQLL
eukprot:TRINITY_DN14426_c0_g1_i1.p1 TRINITY_DN14426_c0_g1~~TRINITY_DN14426_c0_g1_i1.p1  ORF type:complete len:384 (-),score=61.95 TRINITY_DN14426_c0_g1_i1:157-1308(-)